MRQSESRQHSLASISKPPGSAPAGLEPLGEDLFGRIFLDHFFRMSYELLFYHHRRRRFHRHLLTVVFLFEAH